MNTVRGVYHHFDSCSPLEARQYWLMFIVAINTRMQPGQVQRWPLWANTFQTWLLLSLLFSCTRACLFVKYIGQFFDIWLIDLHANVHTVALLTNDHEFCWFRGWSFIRGFTVLETSCCLRKQCGSFLLFCCILTAIDDDDSFVFFSPEKIALSY